MRIPKFNILDAGVVAISLLPLLSCHYGLCSTVSVNVAYQSLIGVISYTLGRKLFLSEKYSNYIFVAGGFLMTVAVTFSLITFGIFRQTALKSGFDNIYFLRGLFKPWGVTNNAWSEITLALTAFSMMAGKFRNILMFLSIVSTLVTFSRGAYISLFLLFFLMLIVNKREQRIRTLYITVSSIFLVAVFCHKEMLTTLSMNSTYSQKASIEWRLNSTKSSVKHASEHPFIGYGCGSYTMISENGDIDNFSSFAPNLPVMLLIENGFIGLGLFTSIALSYGWKIWRYRKENYVKGIGCVFFVIMFKEMSQATLLHTRSLWLLTILLLAYVSSLNGETIKIKPRKSKLIVTPIICFSLVFLDLYRVYNNGKMMSDEIKTGLILLKKGKEFNSDQVRVVENLKKVCDKEPFDYYIKYIVAEIAIRQGKVREGITQLSELYKEYPRNAVFSFSYGNAFHILGDKDKAIAHWKEGVIQYPRLLLCKEYLNIKTCDSMLFKSLNNEILKSYPKGKLIRGKEAAKWGSILYRLGRTEESIHLIRHSIAELPNLSVPWLILGDKKKYNFLTNGLFSNYKNPTKIVDNTTFTLYELLKTVYKVRFRTWYADNLDGNKS